MTSKDKHMIVVMFNFLVKLWFISAGFYHTGDEIAKEWGEIQDRLMEWSK